MNKTKSLRHWGWLLLAIALLGGCSSEQQSVFHTDYSSTDYSSASPTVDEPVSSRVPWDYRVVEGTVGDLIGSDMTILPDNHLLANDDNYATGDKVWTLQFMDAELTTEADGQTNIRLSSWSTLKSYKEESAANKDLSELKVAVTTDVDLIGVYKTEYQGNSRNFAVLELPTGNQIKQPIDDARYTSLEKAATVQVVIEEVHDYVDYDLAYAKFRGWAN